MMSDKELAVIAAFSEQDWMEAEKHLESISLVAAVALRGPEAFLKMFEIDPIATTNICMKCCALVSTRIQILQRERELEDG